MEVFKGFNYNPDLSLALGFFDGVHAGHCCVLKNTVEFAKENNTKSAVITFANSPKEFFLNSKYRLLSPIKYRLKKFEELKIDFVYLIEFDDKIASCTSGKYFEDYILKYFSPKAITTGFNHTFGKDCAGSEFFEKNQQKYNFLYYKIPPITYKNCLVSSSTIKQLIASSDFETAKEMSGYYFFVEGTVIKGNQIGRQIDFPTVNILYPENIIQFEEGSYAGYAIINNQPFQGILNYGSKPTVSDKYSKLLEFHIFDFNKDIYGEEIKIVPLKKIRNEQKFCSVDELKTQLIKDKKTAKDFFKKF